MRARAPFGCFVALAAVIAGGVGILLGLILMALLKRQKPAAAPASTES